MLLLRKCKPICLTLMVLSVFFVQSCNLRPIHAKGDASVSDDLRHVSVHIIEFGRAGQQLRTRLENLLDPGTTSSDKQYDLYIDLNSKKNALAIEQDAEITRYNMVLSANITLKNRANEKIIFKDKSEIVGSYSSDSSEFAIYTIEADTLNRLIKEAAEDIRLRLSNYFINQ